MKITPSVIKRVEASALASLHSNKNTVWEHLEIYFKLDSEILTKPILAVVGMLVCPAKSELLPWSSLEQKVGALNLTAP